MPLTDLLSQSERNQFEHGLDGSEISHGLLAKGFVQVALGLLHERVEVRSQREVMDADGVWVNLKAASQLMMSLILTDV